MHWLFRDDPLKWATELARGLTTVSAVESIFLFGSLARGSQNRYSDIDLIVVVDQEVAERWMKRELFSEDFYKDMCIERLSRAAHILDSPWLLEGWDRCADIFLFPPDWREKLDVLQAAGSHWDPDFMQNISRDATAYDSSLGVFPVAEERAAAYCTRGVLRFGQP